jgi:predicted RecB family nuclease
MDTTKTEQEIEKMAGDMEYELVSNKKVAADMTEIVGPRILYRLYKAGITTVEGLAKENPIDLATKIDVKDDSALKMVKKARAMTAPKNE